MRGAAVSAHVCVKCKCSVAFGAWDARAALGFEGGGAGDEGVDAWCGAVNRTERRREEGKSQYRSLKVGQISQCHADKKRLKERKMTFHS